MVVCALKGVESSHSDAGHPVPTKYNVGIIFRRKINNDTALGMVGHQPGPVSLFFSGLASWAAGIIICFRLAPGLRPGFIFRPWPRFHFSRLPCEGETQCPADSHQNRMLGRARLSGIIIFFGRASWAARYHYFFRAGPAGLAGIIIYFGIAENK